MSILGAIIVPHPPLIIPTVGCGREREVQATIDAYRTAAKQVAAWKPEVLIITSPHQVMYADYFHISPGRGAAGDMSTFGAAQTKLRVEYDAPLRREIVRCAEAAGLRAGTLGQRAEASGNTSNYRNGHTKKTVKTQQGKVNIQVSWDRNGNFEPKIIG